MNYLAQHQSDIQYSVKELSKGMANPTTGDVRKMKKLLRYFTGCPRYVCKFQFQQLPENVRVHTDSDFAGYIKSRTSTSGGIMFLGSHTIKSLRWCQDRDKSIHV